MKKIIFIISLLSVHFVTAQLYTPTGSTNATTNPSSNNVGVGTATPAAKLTVLENGAAGSNQFELRTDHLRNNARYFMKNIIAGSGADDMTFYLRHDGQMFVDGRIGIGTQNPLGSLDIIANGSIPLIRGNGGYIPSGLRFIDESYTQPGQIKEWAIWKGNTWSKGLAFMRYDAVNPCGGGICDVPLYLDDNGKVGIGSMAPEARFHILQKASNQPIDAMTIDVESFGSTSNADNSHYFRIRDIGASGHVPFIIKGNGNVGIGNSSPQYKLDVTGKASFSDNVRVNAKIEAKEIKVTLTPTADFVFEEDYALPKLEDVEKHIKEKKHLPEISSAKVMEKEGVNVGEFQIKLLQKIEELTLYTIEQNKQLKNQREKIEQLEKENAEIKNLYMEVQELKKQLKSNTTH